MGSGARDTSLKIRRPADRHDLAAVVVTHDGYGTHLYCSCGADFFQVNSYPDQRGLKAFREHRAEPRSEL